MIVNFKLITVFLSTLFIFISVAFGDGIHTFSDPEGSLSKIRALVKHGKLKWAKNKEGERVLDFVNSKDKVLFLGDLMGPSWQDPEAPENREILRLLLDLKERYADRVTLVLGNHDSNRLRYLRLSAQIDRGEAQDYSNWLKSEQKQDSVAHRVFFWAKDLYGLSREGVPGPVAWYQKEIRKKDGKEVSWQLAAEKFAEDLRIDADPQKEGMMVRFIKAGVESAVVTNRVAVHSEINSNAIGVIPGRANGGYQKDSLTIQQWLSLRAAQFYNPEIGNFFENLLQRKIPSAILPNISDARWDAVSNAPAADSTSFQYTDRPKDGDQLRGLHPDEAARMAQDGLNGVITGHKPGGAFPSIHRIWTPHGIITDIDVDTSRGIENENVTTTLHDNGDISIMWTDPEGKVWETRTPSKGGDLIGMVTEDNYLIKFKKGDEYIAERYKGYNIETRVYSEADLKNEKLRYSSVDRGQNSEINKKVENLKKAIIKNNSVLLDDEHMVEKIVGQKFILDFRGPSDWAALSQKEIDGVRAQLFEMRKHLSPENIILFTGGNRAQNPNAFESLVHDVFGDMFDIIGFTKNDTPSDEVDKKVKYYFLIGEGDNWDGPVQQAFRFVEEHSGAVVMIAGGGVLKRAAVSKDGRALGAKRLYMLQGYGGASEEKLTESGGQAVRSFSHVLSYLKAHFPHQTILRKKARIGIYPGSFDPFHEGHKEVVRGMIERFGLDYVYVVPERGGQYKPGITPASVRDEMIFAEFHDDKRIRLLSPQMALALGEGEIWDVHSVIRASHPQADLYSIMGTDTFKWYQALPEDKRMADLTLLVNNREGIESLPNHIGLNAVKLVSLNLPERSSTQVRAKIQKNQKPEEISESVWRVIKKHQLYGSKAMGKKKVLSCRRRAS